jgi:hypothetical protein
VVVSGHVVFHDTHDHFVGNQLAAIEIALRLQAEGCAIPHRGPEDVTSREVLHGVMLRHAGRLGSLARALLAEQHQPRPSGSWRATLGRAVGWGLVHLTHRAQVRKPS